MSYGRWLLRLKGIATHYAVVVVRLPLWGAVSCGVCCRVQIRIKLLYNLPDFAPSTGQYYHCRDAVTGSCTEDDVVIPGNTRYNQIKLRLDWAAAWISDNVWVKPTTVSVVGG